MDGKLAQERPDSRFDQFDNLSGSGQPDAVFFSASPDDAKTLLRIVTLVPYGSYVHIHGDRKGSFTEGVRHVAAHDYLATRMGYSSRHNRSRLSKMLRPEHPYGAGFGPPTAIIE